MASTHGCETQLRQRRRELTFRDAFIAATDPTWDIEPSPSTHQERSEALFEAPRSLQLHVEGLQARAEQQVVTTEAVEGVVRFGDRGDRAEVRHRSEQPPIPLQVNAATVNRAQLRQRFLDLHFGTSSIATFLFVHEVLDNDFERKIATTTADEPACIARVTASFTDARLMTLAGNMYSPVARAIARKLKRFVDGPGSECLYDVFGGIHMLVSCGFFSGLRISAEDRACQVEGLKTMTTYISNQRRSPSPREALKYKWGRQGFWLAIKHRKDIQRVESRVVLADGWGITDSNTLSQLASKVPALLERCDTFLARKARSSRLSPQEMLAFLTELEANLAAFKRWQLQ